MPHNVHTQLCRVITGDGLQLEGLWTEPAVAAPRRPVSAFLLVHGTGSHFYASGVLERFAEQAIATGAGVLRINTRGHDPVARIPAAKGSVWGGAAYEILSDCRLDLAAWIEFLKGRGHTEIALAGHSMGAVKSIYAQAHDHHPAVRSVIGISPPRFCHERLMSDSQPFREDYQSASELVGKGRSQELITVRQPLPLLLTAESFLAKYGPHDDYDFLKFLPSLGCPALILIGSESVRTSPAFAGVPEELAKLIAESPEWPLSFQLIEGADTVYSQFLDEPFERAKCWLRNFDPPTAPLG